MTLQPNRCIKLGIAAILSIGSIQMSYAQENPIPKADAHMAWWKDAKLGMFIHWGLYAVPAGIYDGKEIPGIGEWIMNHGKIPVARYQAYAKEFNPLKFDADAWAKVASDAGMKYVVITAKHHDGFAMFDSKVSSWNIKAASPYGKDILKPFVAACHKRGLKVGIYYSQAQDWSHPGGAAMGGYWDKSQQGNMDDYIDQIALPQVKELLSDYGVIDVLWWDTPENMSPERAAKFAALVKKYPKLITNNRLGGGFSGDTETPEQFVPATGFADRNWETCMTMNDTWGFKKNDHNWKPAKILIRNLVDVVSKGGNLLLNIGPNALGQIPAPSLGRLDTIGKWLRKNGAAIYGTTASPFPYLSWGRATRNGQKLYLHVFEYPENGKLSVPMSNKISKAYVLGTPGKRLEVKKEKERSILNLPVLVKGSNQMIPVIVIEFTGMPQVLPLPMQGRRAVVSSQKTAADKPENILDQDGRTGWEAAQGTSHATVEIDLGRPTEIGSFSIDEPWHLWDNKSQFIQFQYEKNGLWKTALELNTNGTSQLKKIKPLVAQRFRLLIENKFTEPGVLDWQIYRPE